MIPRRFKALIRLVRPFTLLAPLMSVFIMFASGGERIFSEWHTTIFAITTLILLTAGSNILNQITDEPQDKISKRGRPIPSGLIKKEEALIISLFLYLFALFRSATVNISFSSILFLIALITITYSLPPRIKRFRNLSIIWIALARGFLGPLAGWSVFGNPLDPVVLHFSFITFIYIGVSVPLKDIGDVEFESRVIVLPREKRKMDKQTRIAFIHSLGIIISAILYGSYVGIVILIMGIITVLTILGTNRMIRENHISWYLSYITFALLMIVFGVLNAP